MEWGLLWSWVTSGRQRARVASSRCGDSCWHCPVVARRVRSQCFLPVSGGRPGPTGSGCAGPRRWLARPLGDAVSGVQGCWARGTEGSGTAHHVCCGPAALPPPRPLSGRRASGKPQPRPTALSRVRSVPLLWGLSVVVAAGGWALCFPLAPGPGGLCSSQAQILIPKLGAPPPSSVKTGRRSLLTAVLGPGVRLGFCVQGREPRGPQAGHLSPLR